MKVFISHQKADSAVASEVERRLRSNGIPCYLDTIDPALHEKGEVLADKIRQRMASCTHLLAVLSSSTKHSQWVPWEIGVASEKELPLASYARWQSDIPEFLRHWPYLYSEAQLDEYARAARASNVLFERRSLYESVARARESATKDFYADLRARLRQ